MHFLHESLVDLITQTSTNHPPDVREAMGGAIREETPGTQAAQALSIIATNIDMAETGARAALPEMSEAGRQRLAPLMPHLGALDPAAMFEFVADRTLAALADLVESRR